MKNVILHRSPRVKKPVMLAVWPGVSDVALEVGNYLLDRLDATEFAEIEPLNFFTPLGITVHDNVLQAPVFPENKFYLIKRPEAKNDLIIFYAEAQPDQNHYDLAKVVLDVAERFRVKRIYTCAAAMVQHNVEKSRVLAAATDAKLIEEVKKYDVSLVGEFQIRGLNGILLGAARERGIEGICVLGETAQYAAELPNPIAASAILKTLTKIFNLEIDLSEIEREARQMAEEIKTLSQEFMAKYISHFTQPIWERNPRNEYEDDDEDDDEDG